MAHRYPRGLLTLLLVLEDSFRLRELTDLRLQLRERVGEQLLGLVIQRFHGLTVFRRVQPGTHLHPFAAYILESELDS